MVDEATPEAHPLPSTSEDVLVTDSDGLILGQWITEHDGDGFIVELTEDFLRSGEAGCQDWCGECFRCLQGYPL
jgi:hypothetical protein